MARIRRRVKKRMRRGSARKQSKLNVPLTRAGFSLTKWAFTNKPSAVKTAKNLKAGGHIINAKVMAKKFMGRIVYLLYVKLARKAKR